MRPASLGALPQTSAHPRIAPITRGPQRASPCHLARASSMTDRATETAAGADPDVFQFQKEHDHVVTAGPAAPPVILLPGFGNKATDYEHGLGEGPSLAAALRRRGFQPYVLPIQKRKQWLSVGRALLTLAYWRGSCTTHPGYSWYLRLLEETVEQARLDTGCDQVDLVAHSAGGWLGRAFIGGCGGEAAAAAGGGGDPHPAVRSLVTLGTPHIPAPPELARDMTGGALPWVNECWPGAHYGGAGVKYVSVAGRAVRGSAAADPRTLTGYAHSSYSQVCGEGATEGDAVVPLRSALLEGAEQVVIPGCYHSMSRVRTFNEPSGHVWYGSDDVVDLWLRHLA